jgi:hypothetical protein
MPPAGLHKWVSRYNWDDGLAPIWVIADSTATEVATALLIYWRLGGPWMEAGASGVNAEAKRLQDTVRDRLLAGFYPPGESKFDPKEELSRTQVYQLRKAGLPELLLGQAPEEPA